MSMQEQSKASKWFSSAVSTITDKLPDGMVDISSSKTPPVGEIILYKYDPKTKETLPYYDTNPLVLVIDFTPTGFTGINLHYIPPEVRRQLIKKMKAAKESSRNGVDYIQKVLPMLSAIGGSKLFEHAYKKYLGSHVRSRIAVLGVSTWTITTNLPLQSFVGASTTKVYKNYRRG